ncbi:unnamed protein product [Ceratitis capitata]|uniref:(Mediterranean fruit fly) hypothetical protein n=1 Tax=Ceratitis capitata TaxID=7213 RepID=A0A811U1G9_CERCA|nr:unnamed protein product [Ceratitis capitata]
MSIEIIATNLFLFYVAGYETTASIASFTAYELSRFPETLEKAQRDVREAMEKHNNKLTYETIQDMKYLDLCIMETTRKYPGLPILNRQCTHDYPLPDSDLVIKSGTPVIISLLGLHRDEKYFPEPMLWDPERFLQGRYDPVAFMPFGEGPRQCIAQRLGKIIVKVALAKLLLNFNIEFNPVRKEIEIANYGVPIMAKGGINIRLSKRKEIQSHLSAIALQLVMFLLLLLTACTAAFFYIKWNYTYWQRKGFPYYEPKIPFGVLDEVRKRKATFGIAVSDVYRNTKDRVVGIYLMTRPALLVRDAHLARDMLTRDFESFHDRGIHVDDEKDPQSSGGVFFLKGLDWKSLRVKLTPLFTSGKLKAMFGTVEDVGDKMVNYLNAQLPDEGAKEVEMKSVMSTFAIDIIASVILGLEVDSFVEPNNAIRNISRKINLPTLERLFMRLGWREEAPNMMRDLVKQTIQMREAHNISRKDMLQLLMQLRNKGEINADDNDWSATKVGKGGQ